MPILTLASNFTTSTGSTLSLSYDTLPDELIPIDWLSKGFTCTPFVQSRRKDGTIIEGTQIKGFEPQNTITGYRKELVDRVTSLGYPVSIRTDMISISCNGMCNVDIDVKGSKNGETSWSRLREKYNILEEGSLFEVKTRSGGRHLYFRTPEGQSDVTGSVCLTDTSGETFDGIDIRSMGNLLYAPMKITKEEWVQGKYVVVKNSVIKYADLPEISPRLYQELHAVTTRSMKKIDESYTSGESVLDALGGSEGSRNVTLHRACCAKVAIGWSDNEVYEFGFKIAENSTPPMDLHEARTTIASALKHAQNPREQMLRAIRSRYVVWINSQKMYVIDLKRAEGDNRFEFTNFLRSHGQEYRVKKKSFLTEAELDNDKSKGDKINVFEWAWTNSVIRKIDQVGYRPGAGLVCAVNAFEDIQNEVEVRMMYNSYRHPRFELETATFAESEAFISDWLTIARYICCNNDADLKLFLDWLSFAIQNPTLKINFAPYFVNPKGSGRGTVLGFVSMLFGKGNVATIKFNEMIKDFNAIVCKKRLVWIDELPQGQTPSEQHAFTSTFNKMVTEGSVNMTLKGVDTIEIENYALVMMSSNYRESLRVNTDERRILPFVNMSKENKPPKELYTRINKIRECANSCNIDEQRRLNAYIFHLHNFLRLRDVRDFNHGDFAPRTSSWADITETSRNDVCRDLEMDMLNRLGVFKSEIVTIDALQAHLKLYYGVTKSAFSLIRDLTTEGTKMEGEKILSELRVVGREHTKRLVPHPKIIKADLSDFETPCLHFESKYIEKGTPTMYVIKGADPDAWRSATNAEIIREYLKMSGLSPKRDYISTDAEINQMVKDVESLGRMH